MKPHARPDRHPSPAIESPAATLLAETRTGRWLAESTSHPTPASPVRHVVRGMVSSPAIHARFERMRTSLASLSSASMAAAHDLRTDANARLHFVVDPLQGGPIDVVCDRERVHWLDRVALVERVCAAVQEAHERSVMHFGIEPGNVFVQAEQDAWNVQVAGFGIATTLHGAKGAPAVIASEESLSGAARLAPEQTGHVNAPVDARADVYALAVLLHELLVGAPPYDESTIGHSLSIGMLHWMYVDGPPAASTRLHLLGEDAERAAAARSTTVDELAAALRQGLDAILARALSLDPAERHASPAELGRDLLAFRRGWDVACAPAPVVSVWGVLREGIRSTWERRPRSILGGRESGVVDRPMGSVNRGPRR